MSQRSAILFAAALLAAAPAMAGETYRFKPYVAATWTIATDSTFAQDNEDLEVELSTGAGWEAGFEWRFGRYLGAEAAYGWSKQDIEVANQDFGDATFKPITVSLNFHFLPPGKFDLWAGPSYVFSEWEKELPAGVAEGDNTDSGFGATAGFDWLMGETWALTGGVRWFDTQIAIGRQGKAAVDPLIFRFGVAWKL